MGPEVDLVVDAGPQVLHVLPAEVFVAVGLLSLVGDGSAGVLIRHCIVLVVAQQGPEVKEETYK